ncbi:DUF4118 domain-containing protein [Allonocardiopsis opalescens]|uniref:histidine kinase n=1 Tax=Allonocardiopsis opalescens TaxID=1144618 RepID=A0A2T0PTD4_9ACTN|nr:DUF4118 domain-containing protein [Allonocardiopsis opalescens]PRX92160.1 two-component system sensor histidine kinase KdpD [Allonocardiopsis opalescens]
MSTAAPEPDAAERRRGRLRIYLGAAPGVGKTYAMLGEAQRKRGRGGDVVIGFAETHGRAKTAELLAGLETVPRRTLVHRGAEFTEMDVDAVLRRAPKTAVVDELAHTNVPGSRNTKRWHDVNELLAAGIDVITTVNIQHLESLNDVVEQITGVRQRETVPDEVVRRADQIELVDMSPQSLRRRMAHGNIYPAEKIDAALSSYFREGNLTALRELALLWVADRVDEGLSRYRGEHGIRATWEARERIVVALTGGPEGETLIRRAARIAARTRGSGQPQPSELLAVHVSRSDGLAATSPLSLARQRQLVESLGGSFHQVIGDDVPAALLEFARGVNATQIVLGSSRRRRWQYVSGPGVGATVARDSGEIDVHMVTHEEVGRGRGMVPQSAEALSRARKAWGWALAVLAPPVLSMLLHLPGPDRLNLTTDFLLFLGVTVLVALVGGLWPAMVAAVWASMMLNFFFTPPTRTLVISHPDNVIALGVFVAVGVSVAAVVDLAARRAQQAARARAESSTLSLLSTSVLSGERTVSSLLRRVSETFGQTSVTLLERNGGWRPVESVGGAPCTGPGDADVLVPVSDTLSLALRGRVLPAEDQRVISAFAIQVGAALERHRLVEDAAAAKRQAEHNKIRTALLAAVSHDLRTPLASIKASVSSLRATDIDLDPYDQGELLATIEESADRLDGLVGNLLDMSRLQTGSVVPKTRAVTLEEVVPAAVVGVPPERVKISLPECLPPVLCDPGLLERAVANVVENAVKHAPGGSPVLVAASSLAGTVQVRVVDRGPGVPDAAKERIFEAFQRLGDAPRGMGVGLGLAVARGFTEAMSGTLSAEDTPGGGLTMVFSLPAAQTGDGGNDGGAVGVEETECVEETETGRVEETGRVGGAERAEGAESADEAGDGGAARGDGGKA